MTIRGNSWSFMLNDLAIRALELDAEFEGQAVVGVVLEVRVIRFVVQMLDGVFTVTIPKKG